MRKKKNQKKKTKTKKKLHSSYYTAVLNILQIIPCTLKK